MSAGRTGLPVVGWTQDEPRVASVKPATQKEAKSSSAGLFPLPPPGITARKENVTVQPLLSPPGELKKDQLLNQIHSVQGTLITLGVRARPWGYRDRTEPLSCHGFQVQ